MEVRPSGSAMVDVYKRQAIATQTTYGPDGTYLSAVRIPIALLAGSAAEQPAQ